jgi:hypothetical protein
MNKIFISYSHKDEAWKDRLVTHLKVLERQDLLEVWDDRKIGAGDRWFREIERALQEATIAILLISADFLSSGFILREEVPRLLERREKEGVRVIPFIIRPCAWEEVKWLNPIQARPLDGRALSGGNEHQIDTDLAALMKEITKLISADTRSKTASASQPIPPEQIYTSKLPPSGRELFGREKELETLDQAWSDPHTHILTLVAWGGVGKTSLVNEWLNRLGQDNYRGAVRVYGWSFYSQGTREDRQASADEFLADALKWFGDPDPSSGGPWDKGVRLAGLIRRQRTLLIFDGLEPLQYPLGELHGRLRDQGMQALLRELARLNPGLCMVTTRFPLADLEQFTKTSVREIPLEHLSPEAGAQLLKSLGVRGTEAELRQAAGEFKGHALALNLLGSFLVAVCDGDIRKRDLIPNLTEEEEHGGHARRVMESYERWLVGKPELDILYLMGLFDRPAAGGAIEILRAKPPIKGLTSKLKNLDAIKWKFAVKHLRDLHLLAEKDEGRPETLDCHPLVREHFGEKLRKSNPKAWKEAHNRLYKYYKNLPEKQLPDTLEEMEPLFAAVAHGCKAGRHQEVGDEVYYNRIQRGQTNYCCKKLGAFGVDLAVLAGFFETPWSQPVSGLTDGEKAAVLNWAGFRLRALGRLLEAAQPMQVGLEASIKQEDWESAAQDVGNLCELYLTLGEVEQAVAYARQSVEFADRSGDGFQRKSKHTTLADAFHQAGKLSESEHLFREAEAMQQERQPEYPYLYSLPGFGFCDLLLDQGQYGEVEMRARQTLEWAKKHLGLWANALDKLSLGRALLFQVEKEKTGEFTQTENYLNQSVADLREAGVQEFIVLGLLARAALYRIKLEFARAWDDLEETREIAERGSMRLHLADYHLEAYRLCLAEGNKEKAEEHRAVGRKMVGEMGYGRRSNEF